MAGIPTFTRNITGNAVASYDWLDLTSGIGYRTYSACIGQITSGNIYFISPRLFDANPVYQEGTHNTATFTKVIDLNFDAKFSIPSIIGGKAYINTTSMMSATNGEYYVKVYVYHVDAALAETEIGTVQGPTKADSSDTNLFFRQCYTLDLTLKKFKIGEMLRLNVEVWARGVTGIAIVRLYSDPESRNTVTDSTTYGGGTVGTDLVFNVPFKIDLT